MNVNLDYYRIFSVVGKTLNFSSAAKELFITQSAVSQAIKQLEDQLGCTLFIRRPRGVVLTEEGKMLLEHINSALGLIKAGESKIEKMRKLLWGELKIAAGDTISKNFLITYLEKFNTLYPSIRLHIINRTSLQALQLLKSGEVDLIIGNLPLDDESVDVIPCADIHDVFIASTKFSELKGHPVSRRELMDYPVIMLEPLSNSRRYVERNFKSDGFILKPTIELGAHDLLIDFARINLGVACVIREFAKEVYSDENLFEIDLTPPLPARQLGICTLKGVTLSNAAQMFIKFIISNQNNKIKK